MERLKSFRFCTGPIRCWLGNIGPPVTLSPQEDQRPGTTGLALGSGPRTCVAKMARWRPPGSGQRYPFLTPLRASTAPSHPAVHRQALIESVPAVVQTGHAPRVMHTRRTPSVMNIGFIHFGNHHCLLTHGRQFL